MPLRRRPRQPITAEGAGQTPAWAIEAIVGAGNRMDAKGWVPATAGNLSVRLDGSRIAITRSGDHKGFLTASSIMQVGPGGTALTPGRPSAETLLHCQIYRLCPEAGAVLHGHSIAATVLSMSRPGSIALANFELLKAFDGQRSHAVTIELPVVDNDQDIGRLAAVLEPVIEAGTPVGYLIRGHGAYVWGPDMPAAMARLEALEFLLSCELERRKLER